MPPRDYSRYFRDRGRYSRYSLSDPLLRKYASLGAPPRTHQTVLKRTLKRGDNLISLSKKYGVPEQMITKANKGLLTYRPGVVVNVPQKGVGGKRKPIPPVEPVEPVDLGEAPIAGILGLGQQEPAATTLLSGSTATTTTRPITGYTGYQAPGVPPPDPLMRRYLAYQRQWEGLYQTSLRYTGRGIREYGYFPQVMSERMAADLQENNVIYDLEDLGYQKQGSWYIRYDPIDIPAEAAALGYQGGGGGGGGGGFGRGGGGGGGGGRAAAATPRSTTPYRSLSTGQFAQSRTGRIYYPENAGLIYWRI